MKVPHYPFQIGLRVPSGENDKENAAFSGRKYKFEARREDRSRRELAPPIKGAYVDLLGFVALVPQILGEYGVEGLVNTSTSSTTQELEFYGSQNQKISSFIEAA